MRITIPSILFCLVTAALSQPVSVGVKGGVPITDAFATFRGNESYYATNTKRYLVGPAVQINLPARFAVEADALYKRLGYQYNAFAPQTVTATTVANSWEFPFLVKYSLLPGPVRPFVGAGGSVRHISGIEQVRTTVLAAGSLLNTTVNPAAEFNRTTDAGFVFGGGVEFKFGRVRIAPEFRYTRWGSENFRDPVRSLLRTNRNQGDFLLGIMF